MRLLEHESAAVLGAGERATAAGRVYDKLHAHLSPLVGDAGVHLLFLRSAKLTQGEFARLADVAVFEGPTKLRERLHADNPSVGTEAAAMFFGTFLALIMTFIGERLTTQLLRSAWPTITEETAPTDEKNE